MPTTPREETASAAGGTDGGFPNKRAADGQRAIAEQPGPTGRSEAMIQQIQQMGTSPSDPSQMSAKLAAQRANTAAAQGASGDHGQMDHMEEEPDAKLESARVFHRLAAEGKLKYDYVGHGSETYTGVIPTLRNVLIEGSKDYFQQFHKFAKRRDGSRAHTAESYKGFLQEQFVSELTPDKELPGVTSVVYAALLSNQNTGGIIELLRALDISLRKPGVGDSYTTQAEQDAFNQQREADEAAALAKARDMGWPKYQTQQKEQEVANKA
eukprot:533778-Rhodomonas_salina.2